MDWLTLILSMPTENATARMRAWRALKSCGAAVLRDGVYLLPARDASEGTLTTIAQDVHENGGAAHLARAEFVGTDAALLQALFDRSADYGELMQAIGLIRQALSADTAMDTLKQLRKLRKTYAQWSRSISSQAKRSGRPTRRCWNWKREPTARLRRTSRKPSTESLPDWRWMTIKAGSGRPVRALGWTAWPARG